MNLLFVTPRFPYPPLKGDQVVSYHRLRTLSQRHKITLLTFYQTASELKNIAHIDCYCDAIYPIQLPKLQSLVNVGKGIFCSQLPLQVNYYYSQNFKNHFDTIIKSSNFDLVHVFMMRMAPYFHQISAPKIIELIDSMQLNLERRLTIEPFHQRWLFQEELRRVIDYEQILCDLFNYVVVVSKKDKDIISNQQVQVIPNGIDTKLFTAQQNTPLHSTLIFSGNMSYAPNIHAVKWFVKQCLPIIKRTIPEVYFIIAGVNPTQEICNLGQVPGVKVIGYVASMSETLQQANVAIAPMQSGSGIQNKILEAMASELPVITTTLGLGSLKAKPGQEILVADSPKSFAETTITLLQNRKLAKEIGHQARKFVVNYHSWETAANQIEELYTQIVGKNFST
ncbi:glycosyltransferase [Anabaena sp. WFMT]|uniref:glycosyltransferase n=1 Tax=Anabaena sp. WFMT TaxID=3449730 RepID=UPI003F250501